MAFTSDIFKAWVGVENDRHCIELEIVSGYLGFSISEIAPNGELETVAFIQLDANDVQKLADAMAEANNQLGGGR